MTYYWYFLYTSPTHTRACSTFDLINVVHYLPPILSPCIFFLGNNIWPAIYYRFISASNVNSYTSILLFDSLSKLAASFNFRPPPFANDVTVAVLIATSCHLFRGQVCRVLTCSWKAGPSDVGAASRSSAGTPRTRCQPSSRRSQGEQNAGHKAGVGPEGGRDGLEESCSSTPRKRTGWEDVADVVADVASTPCKRDATPIDSCVANVVRLLARVSRGWFLTKEKRERMREREESKTRAKL